jgi:hypothetical protein
LEEEINSSIPKEIRNKNIGKIKNNLVAWVPPSRVRLAGNIPATNQKKNKNLDLKMP